MKKREAAALALLVALSVPLHSRAAGEEEELELLFGGAQKVSSASKGVTPEAAKDAAAEITVISRDEILAFGYRTLADVIASVPECFVGGDRVYEIAGIRGIARDGDFNTRVLLLIDGHEVNEPWNHYAPFGTDFPLDLEQVERVEIISGPVSAIYGSNAFFGAVNVVTRTARGTEAGAAYRAGSGGLDRGRVSYASPHLLLWGTAAHSEGDSLRFAGINATERGTDRDTNAALYLRATGGRVSFSAGAWARRHGLIGGSYGSNFGDDRSFTQDAHAMGELSVAIADTKSLHLRARAFGDAYAFDDSLRFDPDPVFVDHGRSTWGGAEAVAEWRPGPLSLLVSVADRYDRVTGVSRAEQAAGTVAPDPGNPTNLLPVDDRRFNVAQASLQASIADGEFGRLVAGVYGEQDQLYGVNIAPRAGLILHPFKGGTLKALYQRGFRSPSIYERYFTDGDTLLANPGLRSESVDGFEFSLTSELPRHTELTLSAFDGEYRDLIIQVPSLSGAPAETRSALDQQYRNEASLRSGGATVRVEHRERSGTVRADVTGFARTANGRTGTSSILGSPEWLAHAVGFMPAAEGRATLALRMSAIGARLGRDDARLAPVFLGGAAVRMERLWHGLFMTASVENLFDSRYGNPVADEYASAEVPMPGRRFFLELGWGYSSAR